MSMKNGSKLITSDNPEDGKRHFATVNRLIDDINATIDEMRSVEFDSHQFAIADKRLQRLIKFLENVYLVDEDDAETQPLVKIYERIQRLHLSGRSDDEPHVKCSCQRFQHRTGAVASEGTEAVSGKVATARIRSQSGVAVAAAQPNAKIQKNGVAAAQPDTAALPGAAAQPPVIVKNAKDDEVLSGWVAQVIEAVNTLDQVEVSSLNSALSIHFSNIRY